MSANYETSACFEATLHRPGAIGWRKRACLGPAGARGM